MSNSFPKSQGIAKDIKVYGTSTCSFCQGAVSMFDEMGAKYEFIDTNKEQQKRRDLSREYNWNTVPMIFVDGKFYGGFMDTKKKILSGDLKI